VEEEEEEEEDEEGAEEEEEEEEEEEDRGMRLWRSLSPGGGGVTSLSLPSS